MREREVSAKDVNSRALSWAVTSDRARVSRTVARHATKVRTGLIQLALPISSTTVGRENTSALALSHTQWHVCIRSRITDLVPTLEKREDRKGFYPAAIDGVNKLKAIDKMISGALSNYVTTHTS